MIGDLAMVDLPPLDYRYALDAAMAMVGQTPATRGLCRVPELDAELRQRLPKLAEECESRAAIWVEPLVDTWREDLKSLARPLAFGGQLVVIASQPMARLLPERRIWPGQPLGLRPWGVAQLRRALTSAGLTVYRYYGIHSVFAIGLSLLGQQLDRLGRPALGDRLHFAARLRYSGGGVMATLATVALLAARKEAA
jgi:hypothetical protein